MQMVNYTNKKKILKVCGIKIYTPSGKKKQKQVEWKNKEIKYEVFPLKGIKIKLI